MVVIYCLDFDVFWKENGQLCNGGIRYWDYYLWFYINQEDLCKFKNILFFFNVWVCYYVFVFVVVDIIVICLGMILIVIVLIYFNEYVMILNGVIDVDSYGKVINWDDYEDVFDWMYI